MRELISVSLTGHDVEFRLDDEAHRLLARYLDEARSRLRDDPDREGIIADLETSIGDRLEALLTPPKDRITGSDMGTVLAAIGRIEREDLPRAGSTTSQQPTRGRFLCRIQEGGWFGGICLGVAAYGGFRVDWVRTVFLLLGLVSGGLLILVYLALLLVLPVVQTVGEYERRRDSPLTSRSPS